MKLDLLVRSAELGVLLQGTEQSIEVDVFGAGVVGVDPRQYQNLADQGFEAITFQGQARPELFPCFGGGPFRQGQGDPQAGQGRAQFVGDIAQQLSLAADQALQARAHAIEVGGQHAKLIASVGQARQAVLLVRGLPQIMHGTAQAAQGTGDRQGHQQAEQGQHHQRNRQGTQWPEQAAAVPGIQLRQGDAVDQQVGVAGLLAGVFGRQATPGQPALVALMLSRFEGGGTAREGATYHRVAAFVEYLHIDVVLALALLQQVLGRILALGFVALGPFLGQVSEAGVTAENPGILVEHMPKQDRQPGNQGDGQPKTGKDAPEE